MQPIGEGLRIISARTVFLLTTLFATTSIILAACNPNINTPTVESTSSGSSSGGASPLPPTDTPTPLPTASMPDTATSTSTPEPTATNYAADIAFVEWDAQCPSNSSEAVVYASFSYSTVPGDITADYNGSHVTMEYNSDTNMFEANVNASLNEQNLTFAQNGEEIDHIATQLCEPNAEYATQQAQLATARSFPTVTNTLTPTNTPKPQATPQGSSDRNSFFGRTW